MVFKNFRINIIFRVILLTTMLGLLTWCLVDHYYLRSIYAGVTVILILVEFLWYVDRFNRDVNSFMLSLLHRDFTTHFENAGKGKTFEALYETLNKISLAFKNVSADREIQHRYLELLVDHVQVGILSFDVNERIQLANNALKKILQRIDLLHLDALRTIDLNLLTTVREIKAGQTRLLKVKIGNELLQLSLHAAEFKLNDEYFKLISFQNIRTELDIREMEAWQKLIRVMTHEIMNSISPITSLSSTLHNVVKEQKQAPSAASLDTLDQGLEAIKIRSEGLSNFTEIYRRLTRIPTPSFRPTEIKTLIARVALLLETDFKKNNINFQIHASERHALLDPELMEQVFINLIRNAIDASAGIKDPTISVAVIPQSDGRTLISIKDNGSGIEPEILENIFVPFFTTKMNGSGIGLALTKQIIHLHHAEIKVSSISGQGTTFTIYL
ncbi:MAG: ATP-binding protein [Chryseolinea sp.]